jgi:protocatechuate 3,4-dioxygenase beta subunit
MRNLTEDNLTDAVLATLSDTQDARLKTVMTSFIKHLHAFIRDVEPTDDEWLSGVQFLTDIGHMCHANRQEFILLSDTFGVTALKDAINSHSAEQVTEATLLGPFYREGAPEVPLLHNIAAGQPGEPIIVYGKVTTSDGRPIPQAKVDIWQASGDGFYDVQLADLNGAMGLRGIIRTDEAGEYRFRSIKPASYPVPNDGPVGELLRKLGRHPYRPAHIHFIVSAEGYQPLITEIFVEGDSYLESDAVFGVKDSLVAEFVQVDSAEEASSYGFQPPFYKVEFNFVLGTAH